jgi:hypothetical protein
MTTAECTTVSDSVDHALCNIRLVEFAYGVADDGISTQASARIKFGERAEIDTLLTLSDEDCICDYCNQPAAHIEDGVLLCTPPTAYPSKQYLILHSKATPRAKLHQPGRDTTVTSSITS